MTPPSFRLYDEVVIVSRPDEDDKTPLGLRLIGRIGFISEIDKASECLLGVTVEGWLGPVWCKLDEVRRRE